MDLAAVLTLEILNGVATLVLISVGLAIIFGMMRVINLAHGEFLMLGGYAAIVATNQGVNIWVAMLVAVAVGQGSLEHRLALDDERPVPGQQPIAPLRCLAGEHRLGVVPAQIFKTLVIALPSGKLGVAVVPVPETLSLKAASAALGGGKATMAERAAAERATGYVLGGISPLGQRKRLPTVIDASAGHWDKVLCSAGRRGLEIELAPADLIRLTGAVVAPVAAGH